MPDQWLRLTTPGPGDSEGNGQDGPGGDHGKTSRDEEQFQVSAWFLAQKKAIGAFMYPSNPNQPNGADRPRIQKYEELAVVILPGV